ncbi:MAG: hypothetical protein ACT4PS_19370 [Betaproteobacteria bacterium]
MQANAIKFLMLLALTAGAVTTPAHAAESDPRRNTLQAIDHGMLPGGRIIIRATFTQPLERLPGLFRTYHPQVSIALDFPATREAISDDSRKLTFRNVRDIRVLQSGDLVRVVLHLDQPLIPEMSIHGRALWLTLTPFESPRQDRERWYMHAAP